MFRNSVIVNAFAQVEGASNIEAVPTSSHAGWHCCEVHIASDSLLDGFNGNIRALRKMVSDRPRC
jgi:hypothetical protein